MITTLTNFVLDTSAVRSLTVC